MKIVEDLIEIGADDMYLILDTKNKDQWIVSLHDNYKSGQKASDYDEYFEVVSSNAKRKINDSLDCFIEDNGLVVFLLEDKEKENDACGLFWGENPVIADQVQKYLKERDEEVKE